jgi:hypothetical protein
MSQPAAIARNSNGFPHQDYFLIGSDQSPGNCTIKKLDSPRGWDERAGYAQSGATLVPKGDPLAVPVISVRLWTGDQYAAWKIFSAKYLSQAVKYAPGTLTPKALSLVHPILNDPPFYITEVVVQNVTAIPQTDDGIWEYEIEFRRYRKPQLALGKPDAAIPAAQATQSSALDKQNASNAAKAEILAGLAGGPPT